MVKVSLQLVIHPNNIPQLELIKHDEPVQKPPLLEQPVIKHEPVEEPVIVKQEPLDHEIEIEQKKEDIDFSTLRLKINNLKFTTEDVKKSQNIVFSAIDAIGPLLTNIGTLLPFGKVSSGSLEEDIVVLLDSGMSMDKVLEIIQQNHNQISMNITENLAIREGVDDLPPLDILFTAHEVSFSQLEIDADKSRGLEMASHAGIDIHKGEVTIHKKARREYANQAKQVNELNKTAKATLDQDKRDADREKVHYVKSEKKVTSVHGTNEEKWIKMANDIVDKLKPRSPSNPYEVAIGTTKYDLSSDFAITKSTGGEADRKEMSSSKDVCDGIVDIHKIGEDLKTVCYSRDYIAYNSSNKGQYPDGSNVDYAPLMDALRKQFWSMIANQVSRVASILNDTIRRLHTLSKLVSEYSVSVDLKQITTLSRYIQNLMTKASNWLGKYHECTKTDSTDPKCLAPYSDFMYGNFEQEEREVITWIVAIDETLNNIMVYRNAPQQHDTPDGRAISLMKNTIGTLTRYTQSLVTFVQQHFKTIGATLVIGAGLYTYAFTPLSSYLFNLLGDPKIFGDLLGPSSFLSGDQKVSFMFSQVKATMCRLFDTWKGYNGFDGIVYRYIKSYLIKILLTLPNILGTAAVGKLLGVNLKNSITISLASIISTGVNTVTNTGTFAGLMSFVEEICTSSLFSFIYSFGCDAYVRYNTDTYTEIEATKTKETLDHVITSVSTTRDAEGFFAGVTNFIARYGAGDVRTSKLQDAIKYYKKYGGDTTYLPTGDKGFIIVEQIADLHKRWNEQNQANDPLDYTKHAFVSFLLSVKDQSLSNVLAENIQQVPYLAVPMKLATFAMGLPTSFWVGAALMFIGHALWLRKSTDLTASKNSLSEAAKHLRLMKSEMDTLFALTV